ncbi:hypothetical protein C8R43DRAFT_574760 [Mycena crocata]|nr:hypothetical protein C8R43DRAFT_574760 [Mycena crocata]
MRALDDLLLELQEIILRDRLDAFSPLKTYPTYLSSSWSDSTLFTTLPFADDPHSVLTYFRDSFPSFSISPQGYVATSSDAIADGEYETPTNPLIHHAINTAFERNNDDLLLKFLLVVAMVHDLGHAVRHHSIAFFSKARTKDEFPFYCEQILPGILREETGFELEVALFGGIVGVIFQDEQELELDGTFPFFELDYTRIAYFCLTVPTNVTYKIDAETIRSRMVSSQWLDIFDLSELEIMETPSFLRHRLCAVLNSTHLPRPDADDLAPRGQSRESLRKAERQGVVLPADLFNRVRYIRDSPEGPLRMITYTRSKVHNDPHL